MVLLDQMDDPRQAQRMFDASLKLNPNQKDLADFLKQLTAHPPPSAAGNGLDASLPNSPLQGVQRPQLPQVPMLQAPSFPGPEPVAPAVP